MINMYASKLSVSILFVLMINPLAFSQINSFASSTVVYVNPTTYTANSVGENVSIQIQISQVINLTAYQFKLTFNKTLLNCLSTQIGSMFPPPPKSTYNVTIDNNQGTVNVTVQLQTGQQPASGNGVLLGVTFNATYGTPYPQTKASCPLGILNDTLYAGDPPTTIPHSTINGTYISPYIPPQISLSLNADNSHYFEEKISINGTLTGNGYPVPDALVALEIQDPGGRTVVGRTFPTSSFLAQCPLNILGLTPCEQGGIPKSNFTIGDLAYFNVTVMNNAAYDYNGVVMVNAYDSSNASLGVALLPINFLAGQTTYTILELAIQPSATSGKAIAFASIFSNFVKNGGIPLSMEGEAMFNITGSAQGTPTLMAQPSQGSYATILRIHYNSGSNSTGNYSIYAATTYMGNNASQIRQMQITIAGDINKDGAVTLNDLVILALAYGSKPGDPKWNPVADINRDGTVNLPDLVALAQNYGKSTNP